MRVNGFAAAAGLLLITALPTSAQQRDWSAWQGCWQPVGMDVPAGEIICILPGDNAASARIATVNGARIVSETVVRADGVARPIEEGGCKGTQSATFSADGRRIYTRTEMDCGAGTIKRLSTGAIAMLNESEWVDAQAVTVEGQHATRTARYQAVAASRVDASIAALLPTDRRLAQEAARMAASAPLTPDQVVEATRLVAPPVIEAILAAHQHGFKLSAATLKELKGSGVPESTLDVMVALSYPQRFEVKERPAVDQYATNAQRSVGVECDYDPFFGSRNYRPGCDTGYGYGRYGYDRYGYSPYNNYYNNNYNGSWNGGRDPIIVVIDHTERDGGGEVVRGRGYTRGTTSTGSSTPRATSEPSSSGGTKSTAGSSTGTSSGTSSSGTTRTAKPRGGG